MKKITIFVLVLAAVMPIVWAKQSRDSVPKVRYIYPKDDSVVDLRGEENLTFSWKANPIPAGGRKAYKFNLYKGAGYEVVVSQELDRRVFSVDIPADKFEDGATYTWQVKQRDARLHIWSMDYRWRFTVKR